MHLFDYFHGVFLDESLVREHLLLLLEAGDVGGGHDVGNGAEAMEQHRDELDQYDGEEKEDQHDTDGLQMQVLFRDQDLRG